MTSTSIILASAAVALVTYRILKPWYPVRGEISANKIGQNGASISSPFSLLQGTQVPLAKAASPAPGEGSAEAWWPDLEPLSEAEVESYQVVPDQIQRYLNWGKMDVDAIDGFRQAVYDFKARGIADTARHLRDLDATNVGGEAGAKAAVVKLDLLGYFAENNMPEAKDAAIRLASRTIEWQANHEPVEGVAAIVSLEAMQIVAKVDPRQAAEILQAKPLAERETWAYHYLIGRRLAGVQSKSALQDLAGIVDVASAARLQKRGA